MEGFPQNPDEVQYMLKRQLFPDVVVIMMVEVIDVQKRLLPTYLETWHARHNRRKAQLTLLHDLHKKARVSKRQGGFRIFLSTWLLNIIP